jgi:AcrR family transcriptional regulator
MADARTPKGPTMSTSSDTSVAGARPLRADARRNQDAILAAAVDVFAERGVEIALDEVARQAGVGIATLYRHFPTREALIRGAYVREVDLLCDEVDELLATLPPDEAMLAWMQRFVGYVTGKPGMAMALRSIVTSTHEAAAQANQTRVYTAIYRLVEAAERSGAIRTGVSPDDLAGALSGISLAAGRPGSPGRAGRLVALLVDGLRYGAPNPTQHPESGATPARPGSKR